MKGTLMTWWEAEQMAEKIADLEHALDEWALSTPEMRLEKNTLDALAGKIEQAWHRAGDRNKKVFLMELAERVESLRAYLAERLKREVSPRI